MVTKEKWLGAIDAWLFPPSFYPCYLLFTTLKFLVPNGDLVTRNFIAKFLAYKLYQEKYTCTIKVKYLEAIFVCKIFSFSGMFSWTENLIPRPQRPRKTHMCSYCPYSTYKTDHLKNHMFIHTGEKPYVCKICTRGFVQKPHLQKHLLTHSKYHQLWHLKCIYMLWIIVF